MLSPFPNILSFCQQVFLVSSLKEYHNNMFKFSSTYPSTLHIVVHTLQIIHYKFFFCCFLELPIKKTQQIFIQEYNNKYFLMCYSQSTSQSVYLSFCPCLCLYVIHKRQWFMGISKHWEQSWKNDMQWSIFDEIWGVWTADETLSPVFDISSSKSKQKLRRKLNLINYYWVWEYNLTTRNN